MDAHPALLIEAISSDSSKAVGTANKKQVACLITLDLIIDRQHREGCVDQQQLQAVGYHLAGLIEETGSGEEMEQNFRRHVAIVSCHHGDQKNWFRIDGEDVHQIAETEVMAAQACLLLFVRNTV